MHHHHQITTNQQYSSFSPHHSVPRNLPLPDLQVKAELETEDEEQVEAEEMQVFDALYQHDPNWPMMRSMQKHSLPFNAMLSRLSPHMQRLTEQATCYGPIRFSSRLRELKALGDKWCRENEIMMKQRGLI